MSIDVDDDVVAVVVVIVVVVAPTRVDLFHFSRLSIFWDAGFVCSLVLNCLTCSRFELRLFLSKRFTVY